MDMKLVRYPPLRTTAGARAARRVAVPERVAEGVVPDRERDAVGGPLAGTVARPGLVPCRDWRRGETVRLDPSG